MVYIISKDVFGDYGIHDIQSNSCWSECPVEGYAVIPEDMVEEILATKGCCDIVLNEEGTEVVSFTARELPDVPGCIRNEVLHTGNMHLITPGKIGAAPVGYGYGEFLYIGAEAGESLTEKVDALIASWANNTTKQYIIFDHDFYTYAIVATIGKYNRNNAVITGTTYNGIQVIRRKNVVVDGGAGVWQEWEWVNPPMASDTEYRTTERFNGKPVYAKRISFGSGTTRAVDITTDTIDSLVRVEGCWVNGDIKELFTSNYIVTGVSVDRYGGASRLKVEVNEVATNYTGYPVVYYTKG